MLAGAGICDRLLTASVADRTKFVRLAALNQKVRSPCGRSGRPGSCRRKCDRSRSSVFLDRRRRRCWPSSYRGNQHRGGVTVARTIVQGFAGNAQHTPEPVARKAAAAKASDIARTLPPPYPASTSGRRSSREAERERMSRRIVRFHGFGLCTHCR
jgi:hypothetical protein